MDPTKFNYGSQKMLNMLEKLDEMNKSGTLQQKFDENSMLLVALSTTVMVAKKKVLPKEYYQWTKSYLQQVRDISGRQLPNMKGFMEKLDSFEKEHNIEDELQYKTANEVVLSSAESSDQEFDDPAGLLEFIRGITKKYVSTPNRPVDEADPVDDANRDVDDLQNAIKDNQVIPAIMPAPSNESLVP